jgi:prepilin peptidase CpaA
MPMKSYLDLTLIALVFSAAAMDLKERRIPNRLLLAGLLCAFIMHLGSGTPSSALSTGAAGAVLGLLLFLPLYLLRGMAAGDVKMMATVGAFTGPMLALQIGLATCCIGGAMALVIIIAKGRLRATLLNVKKLLHPVVMRVLFHVPVAAQPLAAGESVGGMPYGLAIAAGTLLILWLRGT